MTPALARALRRRATAWGLTQAAIAERSGLSVRQVRRVLRGERVSLRAVEDVGAALGLGLGWVALDGEGK